MNVIEKAKTFEEKTRKNLRIEIDTELTELKRQQQEKLDRKKEELRQKQAAELARKEIIGIRGDGTTTLLQLN